MKTRAFNFGAGPAMLPEEILEEAKAELLDWNHTGMSVLEIGHRTPEFQQLIEEAESDIRELLKIPEGYSVLFLGGPARSHFALIPLNFLEKNQQALYLVSGIWSELACKEAEKIGKVAKISSEATGYTQVPELNLDKFPVHPSYLYYTPNETINGTRFNHTPDSQGIPLVADMTSCLLTEFYNIGSFDLIFAGAQKNIANAGMTLVIVKDQLLKKISTQIPTMFDYRTHVTHHSLYATPPVFNCYLAAKMFKWVKKQGIENLYQQNIKKSHLLYEYIDNSDLYYCEIEKNSRSRVNVCFKLRQPELEFSFLEKAKLCGLLALKGHREVGGIRASMYNSMPIAGVEALLNYMETFAKEASR